MINWNVRMKNKSFWIGMIPAVAIVVRNILAESGIDIELTDLQQGIALGLDIGFGILAMLGIVIDPTTEGVGDSRLAQTYTEPKKRGQ